MKMWSSSGFLTVMMVTLILTTGFTETEGGPVGAGICYAGCASLVVACYASAGLVFGTVTAGVGAPAAALACNAAFGTCEAACIAALLAPTP